MEPAILCQGITKSYGKKGNLTLALRGVDLDVKPGELFMLVGPSGCGKTTLISIIAGILEHDQGMCKIFAHDLQQMSDMERTAYRGKTVGFVFQSYNLIPTLTTTENVSIPLLLNGTERGEAETRAREVLAKVGLGEKLQTRPGELSGGQQQRVAIARALVNRPAIILGDEPTGELDSKTSVEIIDILKKLNEEQFKNTRFQNEINLLYEKNPITFQDNFIKSVDVNTFHEKDAYFQFTSNNDSLGYIRFHLPWDASFGVSFQTAYEKRVQDEKSIIEEDNIDFLVSQINNLTV
jgi:putative ABC transport system ATP-binding protein